MALLTDDPSRSGKYTKWDIKLIKAYYINKAFEVDGHPLHVEESPDIKWVAKRRKLRSAEVVERELERIQEGNGKAHGVRVVAVPELRPGKSWPTRQAWIERMNKTPDPESDPESKSARIASAQEERARIKLEQMRDQGKI